ncbi:hypothetical protein BpHYR1_005043 [Brachionus plicatilis]|uniref:Uncharacterized protein n=1 Tax=Brachionus plicatilis TaxID=10195 RepID=A0A3M7RG90_BRAPC|nr:hypothetical protein BpHYR1_005043 [Brachionus plicatilis]
MAVNFCIPNPFQLSYTTSYFPHFNQFPCKQSDMLIPSENHLSIKNNNSLLKNHFFLSDRAKSTTPLHTQLLSYSISNKLNC